MTPLSPCQEGDLGHTQSFSLAICLYLLHRGPSLPMMLQRRATRRQAYWFAGVGRSADIMTRSVPRSVTELVAHVRDVYASRITGQATLPARPGMYSELPTDLDARLRVALQQRGMTQLYSHQRAAWEAVRAGQHTVIVTPTASGKTLCYNLPVLQSVLRDKVKALYLFPTKALSQDQVAELLELNRAADLGVRAYTFDGDTPSDARRAVRLHGDIVVSNPDMLHQGILPHHTRWAQFFD